MDRASPAVWGRPAMSTTTFRCDSCGAPFEVRAAAEFLSCRHCGSCAPFPSHDKPSQPVSAPPPDPAQERELERLDREWDQEKAPYLTACRDGRRFVAKPAGIVAGGVVYL